MQGAHRQLARKLALRGNDIVLQYDDPIDDNADALTKALDGPRTDRWASVTITMEESGAFESLHLWLASQPSPFGTLNVDRERTTGLLDPQDRFFCPTLLTGDSFAYLTMRRIEDDTWQFGAHGFGPAATTLTTDMINLITDWDRHHRHGTGPDITIHPAGSTPPTSTQPHLAVPRRHTTIAISWPTLASPR